VVVKQDGAGFSREVGVPEEDVVGKKMPRWGYVVEDARSIADPEDWKKMADPARDVGRV